jgi:hypothetical protein
MVDWMIEVLTNFKCDEHTYFLATSIMDRFFANKKQCREISDLHITGVTCMFLASKYEDIYPLKMQMVYEKIAHKKLEIKTLKAVERDILNTLNFQLSFPTPLDFLKVYFDKILYPDFPEIELIQKMSLYLAKMSLHDLDLA